MIAQDYDYSYTSRENSLEIREGNSQLEGHRTTGLHDSLLTSKCYPWMKNIVLFRSAFEEKSLLDG
jgi:hypothetical protein